MACCIECGRELEPGEGRAPVKFDWRHPNGLVCKDCYDGQKGFVGGFVMLIFGAIVGGLSSSLYLHSIARMCGSYETFKTVAIWSGVISAILFLICKIKSNRIPGCLTRLIVKVICFVSLCFAIAIFYVTFSDEGASLKSIWSNMEASTQANSVSDHSDGEPKEALSDSDNEVR